MTKDKADSIINSLLKMREQATDSTASETAALYATLKGEGALIKAGERVNWKGTIMRAAVDLWDTAGNTPDNAPSLWEEINYREGYRVIPETITAGTAFSLGECGWWGDTLYKSLINANVWTPAQYPTGWEQISNNG